MLSKEDLSKLITDEKVLNSVIELSKNKFETEKTKIISDTYGKALGEVDVVLSELGFSKKGKTTESVKDVITTLKEKIKTTPEQEVLLKQIEELKKDKGNSNAVTLLEKKNLELAKNINALKKESAEKLLEVKKDFNSKIKLSTLKNKVPLKGFSHLSDTLKNQVISVATQQVQEFASINENGELEFKDENGAIIVNDKNGYKPKTILDMYMGVPIFAENYKENSGQKPAKVGGSEDFEIPTFENFEQVSEYLEKQNISGDEYYDKFEELSKGLKS